MPELLKTEPVATAVHLQEVTLRLLGSLVLGFAVAWIYRRTRKTTDITASFPTTLVLLSVLIAMVTQVIGESIARAFSLVGALSIVRFRTVVRDTQDTAYVIFAVAVGMAAGASNILLGVIGLAVVGLAAFLLMKRNSLKVEGPAYLLTLRVGIGHDAETLVGKLLDQYLVGRDLVSIGTTKQGIAMDMVYETRLRNESTPNELLKALNKVEGVQNVELQRRGFERD